MRLNGKRALVTGAAGGLGATIAQVFAAEGAKVAIADIQTAPGETLAREILMTGGDSLFVRLDVALEEDWTNAIAAIEARWGGLDILVNNAGLGSALVPIDQRTPSDWDRMMAVNVRGPFLGVRAALPLFRRAAGGSIVNIASVAALAQSQIMDGAYACSKAALTMLTRIVAAQHGAENIRCNSLHPGPIETPMLLDAYADDALRTARLSRVPLGRFGTMEQIAAAALFLASDEAIFINGAMLSADGGASVQ